jgi:hypothetical protein
MNLYDRLWEPHSILGLVEGIEEGQMQIGAETGTLFMLNFT